MKIYFLILHQVRNICVQEFLDNDETTVQIAEISQARYALQRDAQTSRGGCGRIETGNAVTRAGSLMSDVYFMAAAWLWQRRAVPKGPWRHKWGSPSSLAETPAQLDPLPCLLPLHHITHKRLQSLDHATPRGQPVSCYKRLVPHIYIGHILFAVRYVVFKYILSIARQRRCANHT